MDSFAHILNWKLKKGSHEFPGPDGGTCINEAALVAAGFAYRSIRAAEDMPECFSRPICRYALRLNDEAPDLLRQQLLQFVTRLACADSPEIEAQRESYIKARTQQPLPFITCLEVLEGALSIGRQADPQGVEAVTTRMAIAKDQPAPVPAPKGTLLRRMRSWFATKEQVETIS
jgi:hypothetical protein